jgi:hypothetical protein
MSIKIAILSDGTQLISDIKEIHDPESKQYQYLFKKPYQVTYIPEMTLTEEAGAHNSTLKKVGLQTWIDVVKDTDHLVNPATVVTIAEPISDLKSMYEELLNEPNS